MSHDLKTIVSDGNKAKFSHYRDGNFLYVVKVQDEAYWKVLSSTALRIQRIRVLKGLLSLLIFESSLPHHYWMIRTSLPLRLSLF
jgi:hypothetical protein